MEVVGSNCTLSIVAWQQASIDFVTYGALDSCKREAAEIFIIIVQNTIYYYH